MPRAERSWRRWPLESWSADEKLVPHGRMFMMQEGRQQCVAGPFNLRIFALGFDEFGFGLVGFSFRSFDDRIRVEHDNRNLGIYFAMQVQLDLVGAESLDRI